MSKIKTSKIFSSMFLLPLKEKRAQLSVEYLVIISFVFLIFVVVMLLLVAVNSSLSNIMSSNIIDKKNRLLDALSR